MKNNLKKYIHIYRHIYVNTQLKHFAVILFLTQNCKSTRLQLKKKNQGKQKSKEFVVCRPALQKCRKESSGCKLKDTRQQLEAIHQNKEDWWR